MKHLRLIIVTLLMLGLLSACLGMPQGVKPVQPFEVQRYLGKWYEIARLDHSFEHGLQNVTAQYHLNDDGSITVINRGYETANKKWKQAEGKALFVENSDKAYLQVSFFGPFYSSYVVFDLDSDYQYAFVSGNSTSYLWLLARTPEVPADVLHRFVAKAQTLGFDVDSLIIQETYIPSQAKQ